MQQPLHLWAAFSTVEAALWLSLFYHWHLPSHTEMSPRREAGVNHLLRRSACGTCQQAHMERAGVAASSPEGLPSRVGA